MDRLDRLDRLVQLGSSLCLMRGLTGTMCPICPMCPRAMRRSSVLLAYVLSGARVGSEEVPRRRQAGDVARCEVGTAPCMSLGTRGGSARGLGRVAQVEHLPRPCPPRRDRVSAQWPFGRRRVVRIGATNWPARITGWPWGERGASGGAPGGRCGPARSRRYYLAEISDIGTCEQRPLQTQFLSRGRPWQSFRQATGGQTVTNGQAARLCQGARPGSAARIGRPGWPPNAPVGPRASRRGWGVGRYQGGTLGDVGRATMRYPHVGQLANGARRRMGGVHHDCPAASWAAGHSARRPET